MSTSKLGNVPPTLLCCLLIFCAHADTLPSIGVSADHLTEQVPLSSFDGLSKSQIWHRIDGLPYWTIPFDPSQSYYQSVDCSNGESLRLSLHEVIDDYRIFSYSHNTLPHDDVDILVCSGSTVTISVQDRNSTARR